MLIGHSQGTFHLRDLLAEEIEPRRGQRRRLVSALLLGGNVTVARGRDVGGDFGHVRACRSPNPDPAAWSRSRPTTRPVPPDALFGRTTIPGREVLCTNPAALAGGAAPIDAVFPREPFAPGTAIAAAIAAVGFPIPASSATWLALPGRLHARAA